MGANITVGQDSVISWPSQLHGTVIDGSQIPDIIPILSVCAAVADSETRIINAQRLRLKESDRLRAVHDLVAIGADIGGDSGWADHSRQSHAERRPCRFLQRPPHCHVDGGSLAAL